MDTESLTVWCKYSQYKQFYKDLKELYDTNNINNESIFNLMKKYPDLELEIDL